jgi:3-hydroxyisobutyrate dehydrogenase-like beta-hydroxyacid dehydrogenase
MKKSVSIIGVGNMGGGMALNLLARGYSVHVHDVDATKVTRLCQKGALPRSDLSGKNCIMTIICVVDAEQTQAVLFGEQGLAALLPRGHTVMLCPTIAPQDVERFGEQLSALGIDMIDAPMSGGPARARDGCMSLMLACADGVFAQHEPLLRDLSSKLFRVSTRLGDATRTKLVNNLLAASNLAAAAEAMALAERLGLDPSKTLDVIEQSSGQSWIGSERMRRVISGDLTPRAHMTLLAKDTQLTLQMAKSVGFESTSGECAAQAFVKALQAGMGELDDAALIELYRKK